MATKITLFFEIATVYGDNLSYRIGGWSESWIHPGVIDTTSVNSAVDRWANLRAKLLPKQGSIVASRQQTVSPDDKPGKSRVRLTFVKGNQANNTDVPQMAYAMRCHGAGANMKFHELRGFPDQFVVNGEAALTPQMTTDLRAYKRFILDEGLMFRGIQMDVQTVDIDNISDLGVVTTVDDFAAPAVGKKVQILRTREPDNGDDQFGGVFKVLTITDARRFTISRWPNGPTEKGRVRKWLHDFFPVNSIEDEAVFVRKVGRPFFQYRGRAATRS